MSQKARKVLTGSTLLVPKKTPGQKTGRELNEGVREDPDKLEGHAELHATENFAVLGVVEVTGGQGHVVSDIRRQSGALGQLDWSRDGRDDVCQTALIATEGVIVGEAVAQLDSWNDAQPGSDFDRKVSTDFSVGSTDGEVIEETTIEVHWADGGSDGKTDFFNTRDVQFASAVLDAKVGTREAVEELIVSVNQTELGEASVVGQGCAQVELRIIEITIAIVAASRGERGVNGGGVESTETERQLLSQRDAEVEASPGGVVCEPETAEVVAGVVTHFQGSAKAVKQRAGLFWSHSSRSLATCSSASESVHAGASRENESRLRDDGGHAFHVYCWSI